MDFIIENISQNYLFIIQILVIIYFIYRLNNEKNKNKLLNRQLTNSNLNQLNQNLNKLNSSINGLNSEKSFTLLPDDYKDAELESDDTLQDDEHSYLSRSLFEKLTNNMKSISSNIYGEIKKINSRFKKTIEEQLNGIKTRMGSINSRINNIYTRIDLIYDRLRDIYQGVYHINFTFGNFGEKIGKISHSCQELGNTYKMFYAEFLRIHDKLEKVGRMLSIIVHQFVHDKMDSKRKKIYGTFFEDDLLRLLSLPNVNDPEHLDLGAVDTQRHISGSVGEEVTEAELVKYVEMISAQVPLFSKSEFNFQARVVNQANESACGDFYIEIKYIKQNVQHTVNILVEVKNWYSDVDEHNLSNFIGYMKDPKYAAGIMVSIGKGQINGFDGLYIDRPKDNPKPHIYLGNLCYNFMPLYGILHWVFHKYVIGPMCVEN